MDDDGCGRNRRRWWPQRVDLRGLPRPGRVVDDRARGPLDRRWMRVDRRCARRGAGQHLQLRPRRVPLHSDPRRARSWRSRSSLPRHRSGGRPRPARRFSGVAPVPRCRPNARRAPSDASDRGRRLPALHRRGTSRSRAAARAGQRRPHGVNGGAAPPGETRSRRNDAAALEPDVGRRRARPVLLARSGEVAGDRDGPRGVGRVAAQSGHGSRRAELRDEARRARRPTSRWQRCAARCGARRVRALGRDRAHRCSRRQDLVRRRHGARCRADRRFDDRVADRRLGLRSTPDLGLLADAGARRGFGNGRPVAGPASPGRLRVEDRCRRQ